MSRVETFYDAHAPHYEAKFRHPLLEGFKRCEEEAILAVLRERMPPGGDVLELGCGTGIFTEPVARWGCKITAVDVSRGMLDQLTARLARAGLTGVQVRKADIEALALAGPYDAVFGVGLLEYVRDPGALLTRVAGALRPGGVAVFTAPRRSLNGGLYCALSLARKRMLMRLFDQRELARLTRAAGLDLVAISPAGTSLSGPLNSILVARR